MYKELKLSGEYKQKREILPENKPSEEKIR